MKLHKLLFVIASLSLVFGGCKKETLDYENDPRVYFYELTNANSTVLIVSKSFSFATGPADVLADTVFIQAKIMGLATAADRTFTAEPITTGTNAIAGTDYKFLPGTIKANQIMGSLPVIVYRTAELKTITKQLNIRLSDGGDFKSGAVENNKFTLNWNDNLIKPDNWETRPGLNTYFGTYSLVKYQFIISTLGRSSFPLQISAYDPALLTPSQMQDLRARMKAALLSYNNTHATPLTDELNIVITFP